MSILHSRGRASETARSSHVPDVAPHASPPPILTVTTPFRSPSPIPAQAQAQAQEPIRYIRPPDRHRTPEPIRRYRTPEPPRHRTPGPESTRRQTPGPSRRQTPEPTRHSNPDARYAPPPVQQPSQPPPVPLLPRPYTLASNRRPVSTRPYTPHEDAPSDIHPLPVHNATPSPMHRPISIPPDGYIPFAQNGRDGQTTIVMPPPHEFTELGLSHESVLIPPSPQLSETSVPPENQARSNLPSRQNAPHARDYAYDRPTARIPSVPAPQRIAKQTSNHSRASTHLSEYEILAPLDGRAQGAGSQARSQRPVPDDDDDDDDELEYGDVPSAILQVPTQSSQHYRPPREQVSSPFSHYMLLFIRATLASRISRSFSSSATHLPRAPRPGGRASSEADLASGIRAST